VIAIHEPGPLTTVQDSGRPGQLRVGIPPSGPVDRRAFVIANRLVGNPNGAAGLECTLMGPRFTVQAPCTIAVTGAAMPVTVNAAEAPMWASVALREGDVVKLGAARAGVRAYIAFGGGIDVPIVLGSRSTYVRGRLGGYQGRSLKRDDVLRLGTAPPARPRTLDPRLVPDFAGEPELRVVLGPQADRFTADGIAALLGSAYEMLPQSDRMGARLRGARIGHVRGHDIISDGIPYGGIQVPGDGQPIVLLVDRQSTGGYTKVATVCSVDLARLGQVKPGHRLKFRAIDVAEAHQLLREDRAALATAVREGHGNAS
jgi:antagonist of KipI